jgi:hypothetical protein
MTPSGKKILEVGGFFIFFILIVIYAFFRSHDIIFGVQIKNVSIKDGQVLTNNVVKITGNAKNAIKLYLDGREISVDQQGNFDETVVLLPGYNIINIKAQDKFGNIDEKNYKLMYSGT